VHRGLLSCGRFAPQKNDRDDLAGRSRAAIPGGLDMKRWKILALPLACVLAAATAACGGKSESGSSGGQASSGGSNTRVAKFKLGHDVGKDGEAVREGRTFTQAEKVYVSFAIMDAQKDAQARVVWVTKPGVKVAEETKPLKGDAVLNFSTDPKNWEPGTYMVETWVVESGDHGVRRLGTADFTVAGPPSK